MNSCWLQLGRRKKLVPLQESSTGSLGRGLGTFDLIFLGVGSTLGVGIYILSGSVAKEDAGPAIIVSFFIAALISILAGICYAEFSARAPTSGSIYAYSYMTLGEFFAFIMGWNLITQYIIGSASVIKALSVYCDSFLNYTIQNHLREVYEINVPYLSQYFDIVAFVLSIFLAVMLSYGLKESMMLNNVLTSVNVTMVLFFVILGMTQIDWRNWNVSVIEAGINLAGKGGFFPYGFEGVVKGAGACFYGFIGFDCIVTTGDEVRKPKTTIPIALITSVMISFLTYVALSGVLTLMVPYYLQDSTAPLAFGFEYVGIQWAQVIVRIGSFFGLSASLIGAFFPISRIIFAMSQDGLLFGVLGRINLRYGTPVVATMFSGVLTGLTAAVLDVKDLIYLNSLGTLLSYSIVALCVIILAYSNVDETKCMNEESPLLQMLKNEEVKNVEKKHDVKGINCSVAINMALFCFSVVFLSLVIGTEIKYKLILIIVLSFSSMFVLIAIWMQTPSWQRSNLSFKVPLVPFTPALCILLNFYLMVQFDVYTWMRFCFWIVLGLIIYFSYGIFHSKERLRIRENRVTNNYQY